MTDSPIIVWFRQDLREADNPALSYAAQAGRLVIAVYIYDDTTPKDWQMGGASQWWLHHSLKSLSKNMPKLVIRKGQPKDILNQIIKETAADTVVWNRMYEPWATARDMAIKSTLEEQGIEAKSFKANLLFEPWEIKTKSTNEFYKVYTPFMKACRLRAETLRPALSVPVLRHYEGSMNTMCINDLDLLPKVPWDKKFYDIWTVGERGAQDALVLFLDERMNDYKDGRNYPAQKRETTSRLSPHLHFGEISPYQIWHAILDHLKAHDLPYDDNAKTFHNEILWREFSYNLLYNKPDFPTEPMNQKFKDFKWDKSDKNLKAWQGGQTGYPIIDAGMRQLWQTGWMHNRVRMIVGSFLIKDLHIHWIEGEKWFWDTLVDADLASNSASWQWVAGCGADAAPFFRIFNPMTQSQKFDKDGAYIRAFVPELKDMPDKYIHAPWQAPQGVLEMAGVKLGQDYPFPLVDHAKMRKLALDKYSEIK